MKLRVAKMTKDASLSDMMAIGTRVLHSERGCGNVIAVDADDPRHKPYIIEFDNSQVERLPRAPAALRFPIIICVRASRLGLSVLPVRCITTLASP